MRLDEDYGKCNKKSDIIFVVDRSGSVRPSDYDEMRKFLEIVGKVLQIGVKNDQGEVIGQGAIVEFSEEADISITLKQSQTPGEFTRVVNDRSRLLGPLTGGRTKTHLGLAVADTELAIKEAGFREDDPDVKRMLMVITDGEQTKGGKNFVYVKEAMQPFFKRDMDVFALGVGLKKQAAKDEIRDMVEVAENAIFAESYSDLTQTMQRFIRKFCPGKTSTEIWVRVRVKIS